VNTNATVVRTQHADSDDHEHRPNRVRAGAWGLLLGLSILGLLNHVLGVTTFASNGDERMMFTLFAALDLYAMVVLLIAYRRRERWAWAVTWVHSAA